MFLTDLTRLDYQPQALNFEDFDFNEFFREIYEQALILAAPAGIEVQLTMPDAAVRVRGDRLHLRRLYFNIIHNARKVGPPQCRLYLLVEVPAGEGVVSVIDAGPGISAENLPKIFTRFFRIDNRYPGTGLGVNIARTIAGLHDGEIQVESRLGEGSTFRIILPR